MGYSRSSSADWKRYSYDTSTKSASAIFTSNSMHKDMNPMGVKLREARDSKANPESTAIFIATDVTGSMGYIAEYIAKTGLSKLFTEIYERKPVSDPQVMVGAIGDATQYDESPFQVGQFEADLTATEWLEKIHVEGGGGGNRFESYDLPVWFAANHTSIDCYEKRGKKGFLFTIGDEFPPEKTQVSCLKKTMDKSGDGLQSDIPFKDVIEKASKMYHYYHIIIGEGYYAERDPTETKSRWRKLLNQNVIWLSDHKKLAETIISIMQVVSGEDKEKISKSWDGSTNMVVKEAIKDVAITEENETGLVHVFE